MPHALLLSPDDQAVSAITAVLEEMSVTCERPLDGPSAAQQLHSQSFDLVLVDCENLPAAKLILDVCRRGTTGKNPVPMAIVDGHASLPTAFRLGADLILTKPVARDQARNTIRTALSRVRKDVSANDSIFAPLAKTAETGAGTAEEIEQPAAASVSSQTTSFGEAAPNFVSTPFADSISTTFTAPALTAGMHSAADRAADKDEAETEVKTTSPRSRARSASPTASSRRSEPRFTLQHSHDSEAARPEKAEAAKSKQEVSQSAIAGPNPVEAEWRAALFESYQRRRRRMRLLLALLMLTIAGAGFYGAWMYQPGFRALAKPQIDRMLKFAGTALPQTTKPDLPNPSPNRAPNTTPAPSASSSASGSPAPPTKTEPTGQGSTAGSVTGSASGSTTGSTTGPAVKPVASVSAQPSLTLAIGKEPAATGSDAQLPGESSAIILSSKGAEKRLEQSVPPKYPAEVRSGEPEATVLLKEIVDEKGKVTGVRLIDGNAALANAAIKAVKQWRYRPYIRDGKAEPFQTVVIIDFQRP
jgi:TonB family protein